MKVVWVSHGASLAAGAELCLWEGARGLVASGLIPHVIVPAPGRLAECLAGIAVPVSVVPCRWWMHSRFRFPLKRLFQNTVAATRIAQLLWRVRPDVVLTNTLTIPSGAWAARIAGIPHVWYIHEFGWEDHGLKFDLGRSLSLRMVSRLSDAVIVNSDAVHRRFRNILGAHKMHTIYYAVDFTEPPVSAGAQDRPFTMCLTGRICQGKGQEDAVRAVARLKERGIEVRLSLVGNENAEYGLFLRSLVREFRIESQVEFVAFTENPFEIMADSNAALCCSRSEAFGRVTVEAMKLGKPVVGADCGATSELIRDGETGLLYRPGDVEDLSDKIEILARDWDLTKRLGTNAREWAQQACNMEAYTSALQVVLRKVLEARARPLREM